MSPGFASDSGAALYETTTERAERVKNPKRAVYVPGDAEVKAASAVSTKRSKQKNSACDLERARLLWCCAVSCAPSSSGSSSVRKRCMAAGCLPGATLRGESRLPADAFLFTVEKSSQLLF